MGSSKAQTIGFAYFMGLHMVIAKSADALLAIRAAGRTIWDGQRYSVPSDVANGHFRPPFDGSGWTPTGTPGPVLANEQININAPNIFGGTEREGGIAGALDVMFGESTQPANDYLEGVFGTAQPHYIGSFTTVFRGGMVAAMNPYLKAWTWRVRRNLKGWQGGAAWYPTACEIDVGNGVLCMNPAHIIYQVITDTEDGMGYPASSIDDANFRAAADLFKSEGLGLFIKWMKSEKIETFLQQVADHCNATVVQDPLSTLFKIIPMRGGYDTETLLTLTPSNATLETFERSTLEETVNEVTVKWDDTYTLNEGSVTVQALANIEAMGGVVNQTKTYAGIPTESIAKRIAQRDLDIGSALLARCRISANRIANGTLPGEVVALEGFDNLGLGRVYIRVLRAKYGGPDTQKVTLEGAEDVFGLPLNTYVGTQPEGWEEPSTIPQSSPNVEAFEVPFRDLSQILGNAAAEALSPVAGFVGMAAQRPSGLPLNFKLVTRQGTGVYNEVGTGDFTPTATLLTSIDKDDTLISLQALSSWSAVEVGMAAFLGPHPTAEAVKIVSVNGASVGIARGVMDTVPKAWAAGTRLWVYDEYGAADPQEYSAGESVDAKALTVTSTGILIEAAAITDTVTFNSRADRPYPPANVTINGQYAPTSLEGSFTVDWAHRDRVLQADQLTDWYAASIGPEPGTTYECRTWIDSVLFNTQTGLTGTSCIVPAPPNGAARVEVISKRDGVTCWQAVEILFTIAPAVSARITSTGDIRVTSDGSRRIITE